MLTKTILVFIATFSLFAHSEEAKNITSPAPTAAHSEEASVSADQALTFLRNGNKRFLQNKTRSDGQSQKDIERLSKGQHPHSVVIACSDSRVPPEILFDQKLGEIFVIRTAGETLDANALGSVEYALEHLGTKNIVVLGHTNCGAVKAAFDTLDGQDAGSENLNKLVADIHPRIKQFKGKQHSEDFIEESYANVDGVMKDLIARSKIISNKVEKDHVKINSALYDLGTGYVQFNHENPFKGMRLISNDSSSPEEIQKQQKKAVQKIMKKENKLEQSAEETKPAEAKSEKKEAQTEEHKGH